MTTTMEFHQTPSSQIVSPNNNTLHEYIPDLTTYNTQSYNKSTLVLISTENSLSLTNQTSAYNMEPVRDALSIVIPFTIIYGLIFITGVIGNISTCIVIKKNRSMHTATNYYLFSLAISDFLLLLSGVPQEVYIIWYKYPYVFGEYFCIIRGALAEASANATVLTITAFTVERYMAICHPFLGQAMSKLSRAIRIILLIWIVSIVTGILQAAQFGIKSYDGIDKCVVVRVIIQHSFQLSTYIFFFAPMTIILVLYLLIGIRLYRANMLGAQGNNGDHSFSITLNGSGKFKTSQKQKQPSHCEKLQQQHTNTSQQMEGVMYRYSGGAQLSAVRGRMSQYGTRRVLKMLGKYHISRLSICCVI